MSLHARVAGESYQTVNGMERRYHSWTLTDENRLRNLWHRGLTLREIGELMGISRNAVFGKARRLGLKLPAEVKDQRLRMSPGRPLVWPDCPPERQGEYKRLRKTYGYTADEARDIILERMQAA